LREAAEPVNLTRCGVTGALVIDDASGLSLLVRVSGRLCALPLPHVVETMRALPLDAFPGAPPFVRGVAMVRGIPTPVVEVARLLGSGEGPGARWVTVSAGGHQVALAVDFVLGVRALAPTGRVPLPALLQDAAADAVAALARLDAELLLVLQAAHDLPEATWAGLETPAVAVP
jgi:purine-binding chemotaxis protein CheW